VSTLNLSLRTLRLIEAEEDPMASFLAGLSPEELTDYDALGEVEEPLAASTEEAPALSPLPG
jgi:hypothetical protein